MAENKYKQADAKAKARISVEQGNRTSHRERKNPGMADKYAKLRHETNAARGKQVWIPDVYLPADHPVSGGTARQSASGHWDRI